MHWHCTKLYQIKGPVTLEAKYETIIETNATHKRNCDPSEGKVKEMVNQVERKAKKSTPTVSVNIDRTEVSNKYAVQPPKKTKKRPIASNFS